MESNEFSLRFLVSAFIDVPHLQPGRRFNNSCNSVSIFRSGYMCISEMVQFLEDAFIVLKRALLNGTSHFEKIGALYLMYAMYFKQPPKQYCKFRVTMSEWIKMNQFYNEVCIFHDQASLIFWKLLQRDAFR